MVIIQDCREKVEYKQYLFDFFKANEIEVVRMVLQVGDYMLPNGDVSIDLKGGGLQELANDLVNDELSLNKKYRKCYEQKIHLIVLIEESGYATLTDVCKLKNKHGKLTGRQLMEKMYRLQVSYGIEFRFCKRENTGKTILQLLGVKL